MDGGGLGTVPFPAGIHRGIGPRAESNVRVGFRFCRSILNRGNFTQIHRAPILRSDNEIRHFRAGNKKTPRVEPDLLIVVDQVACRKSDIGALDRPLHLLNGHPATGHELRRKANPDLPRPAPDEVCAPGILHSLQADLEFLRHAPQGIVIIAIAVERQVHDGYVVDFDRFDHPSGHSRRDLIDVRLDFVVQSHPASFAIFPDIEAHGHDGLGRVAGRVNILHPIDLIEKLLEARGDLPFDLARRSAGHIYQNVSDRDNDLWVLLARRDRERDDPDYNADEDQQDRKIPFQKYPNNARHPVVGGSQLLLHGTTTSSFSSKPDSTSTRPS